MAATSTSQTSVKAARSRPAVPSSMCLLLFMILVAALNEPVLVKADPPSKIVVYLLGNFTAPEDFAMVVAGYDGSSTSVGAIDVFDFDIFESAGGDSPVIGEVGGQVTILRSNGVPGIYLDLAFTLDTPSYAGTITAQYKGYFLVSGEGSVTGGTGDFRFARGYFTFDVVDRSNLEAVPLITTFHIKYD